MTSEQKRELEEMLSKIGFDSIFVEATIGSMVFLKAEYKLDRIDAVFNIASSQLVYRTRDQYGEDLGDWKQV